MSMRSLGVKLILYHRSLVTDDITPLTNEPRSRLRLSGE